MKRLFAGLMAVCATAGLAADDPLEGMWQTEADDGAFAHVEIAPCRANFCGKIMRSFKQECECDSPNKGKTLAIDMASQENRNYNGKVWRPGNNKIYPGKIALKGDVLNLSSCVMGGLICPRRSGQGLSNTKPAATDLAYRKMSAHFLQSVRVRKRLEVTP
jgi:uncharacterized protein (DUF2147 family)